MTIFNLEGYISELKKIMAMPAQTLKVVIIDDASVDVKCLEFVLKNWPKIKLITYIQSYGVVPKVAFDTDILLLDYYLDGITGDYIARDLRARDFEGVISSISTSISPAWSYLHFPFKKEVIHSELYACGFVHYMNELIKRSQEMRKWR